MEDEIKLICKHLITESQSISDHTDDIEGATSAETKSILEDSRLDALQHVQNLTLRLMEILAGDGQEQTPETVPAEGEGE